MEAADRPFVVTAGEANLLLWLNGPELVKPEKVNTLMCYMFSET